MGPSLTAGWQTGEDFGHFLQKIWQKKVLKFGSSKDQIFTPLSYLSWQVVKVIKLLFFVFNANENKLECF
jgi:hypothetical protein